MKTFTFFILFLISSVHAFAQDTLFTTAGKTINAKVIEVGKNEVKYRSAFDSEKQYSVIALSEIIKINYENGTGDVFIAQNENTANDSGINNGPLKEPSVMDSEYDRRKRRADAITDGVIIGFRVVGFVLRVALEVAVAATGCGSYHGDHNFSHGTNRPRGH